MSYNSNFSQLSYFVSNRPIEPVYSLTKPLKKSKGPLRENMNLFQSFHLVGILNPFTR